MLKDINTEELLEEISSRKRAEEPKQKWADMNSTPLREVCQEYITDLAKGGYIDSEAIEHCIFEEALQYIFGKEVFTFVNERT